MSFTTWTNSSYNTTKTQQEFEEMRSNGVEWVAINHWWWQDYLDSTEIKMGNYSDTFENMTDCFLLARAAGLKVLYKPMLNLAKVYDWRSYIEFTPAWMANYTWWMVENAKAAAAGGVEMLSIGCEMGNMQVHSAEVRRMIGEVRAVYNGTLTYSANHDSYAHVDWWDAVDMIGISMYSMMTIAWDPSIAELRTIWDGTYYELEELALKWNRPVAFTEIGIQAKDGSNIIPNDNQISVEKDIDEMRDYYLSLFQSMVWTAPWFKGAYWWIWDYQDPATDPELKDFNPILIKDTIKAEYEKAHVIQPLAFPALPALVPLAAGIAMLVIVFRRPGPPVLDGGFSFKKRREEETDVPLAPEPSANETKHNEVLLGISIGCMFSAVASSLTIGVYGVIQKSFSYAIILGLSTAEILVTFAAILLLGVVIGLLFLRVLPRYVLIAAFMLLLFYPFLALGNRYQMIFVTTFFDVALLFMFVAVVAVVSIKCKVQNLLRVIIVAVLVAAGFFLLVLAFDTLAIAFLVVPVGLAILAGRAARPSAPPPLEQFHRRYSTRLGYWRVKIPIQMMFVMNSLIAGMLIPFGNSIINLVRTNFLAVAMYYIPALVAASIILVVVTWWRRSAERARFDWTTIFSNDHLLVSNLILGLGGILFILAGRFLVVWAFVSGMYVIQYIGTLVVNVRRTITRDNIGGGFAYLAVAAICFVLGFMINAIKGLLVYVVTFLTIKDGAIVRRDPAIDPVATFDVPLLLDGLVLGVVIGLATVLIVYRLIVRAVVKRRFKAMGLKAVPTNQR
ncbi:MAG: hypothetical protein JW839_11750, partial [Candidatus Lokiarchaeota archaeon]|nr:hypothetical protein [Candidatus Lokiarchaeota archaeon]